MGPDGRLSADELLGSVPSVKRFARVRAEQFSNTASSALTLAQWLQLAKRLTEVFREDPELAGVVVTAGTDTLEEIAYFLNLTVRTDRPIVLVGSMRNASALEYDGPANLLDAFRVAADPRSRGRGVLVVLNGEINAAREVTKTDAVRLDGFKARGHGALGIIQEDGVVYQRTTPRRHTSSSEFDVSAVDELPRVDIVLVYQDASGDLIKALADRGARAIVVAGAGAGSTSGTQEEGIQYATSKGVFVVMSTRTGSGRISADRHLPSPATDARPRGMHRIAADDLAPLKARVLMMVALTATSDGAEIQRMFGEY